MGKNTQVARTAGKGFAVVLGLCIGAGVSARDANPLAGVPSVVERALADPCLAWPADWRQEYGNTIRQALSAAHDKPDGLVRIEIFSRGFPRCWRERQMSDLTKAGYETLRAEMRWYCETLVAEQLAPASEKALLKSQFRELCDYATGHLRGEFPFLADRYVQQAKRAALRDLDDQVEAPLSPLFRRPFAPEQLDRIKANWARLHQRWFFVWREVRYGAMFPEVSPDPNGLRDHPQCEFVKRCLKELPGAIWPVLGSPPAYVVDAAKMWSAEKTTKMRAYIQSRQTERDLSMRFTNHVEPVEQWSFVFTALCETAVAGGDGHTPVNLKKGGDAYELKRHSPRDGQ